MSQPRILAIDLRSQLLGFAILEGPATLLDFGRTLFYISGRRRNTMIVRKRVAALLDLFLPSVIVLKRTSGRRDLTLVGNKGVFAAIKREAELRSLELILLKRRDIYYAFQRSGNKSKDDVAALIAGWFPEVEWKLPPRRKNYDPEHHAMTIFDAISIGLAYFADRGEGFPTSFRSEMKTPG
jgi:hypothetical protein